VIRVLLPAGCLVVWMDSPMLEALRAVKEEQGEHNSVLDIKT